ncbi:MULTISPECIES: thioredoxin domain-containing protein [unclassified Streptomyces]|uniref:thioredoxin domain-containing protein n=1 Tax=unclassified Streptomyces TaxID=2593676 RepID=UPI002E2A7D88|nr:thioredoxin domain-containing protein [Streptomyces sp. NBC_00223]
MSSRNSKASKEAARERLRAQREKDAKRAKIRRQLFVGGGIVVVLAVAAGVAVAVNQMNKPGYWEAAANKPLVKPAHSSGKNGSSIVVGDPSNKHVLKVYEDLRCPVCAAFEQGSGDEVQDLAGKGKYQISYTMGTFLDGPKSERGTGSKNALSALGAALNVSTDAFVQYHKVLYSKDVHPDENSDVFGKDANLIKYAQQVPALKNNKAFQKAVEDGTYDKWALTMSKQFDTDGIGSTPTVKLDGQDVKNVQAMAGGQFTSTIMDMLK